MVGYTPSLSTAVWVGTEQGEPLRNYGGAMIYGSSLPSDIWKDTMDGALEGTPKETFPKPAPIKGQAGVPEWTAPYTAPSTTEAPPFQPPVVITPSQVEILPGITIPVPGVQPNPQAQVRPQPQQPSNSGPLPGQPTAPADGSPSTGQGQSGEDSSDSGEDSGGGGTGGGQGVEDSGGTSGAPPGRSR